MDTKIRILNATIEIFNEKGLKFTMDDLAKRLGMSKKTIYSVFSDKEELFFAMVDYFFESVKEGEKELIQNPELSTVEKIRGVLGVLPEKYSGIDFAQLYGLKEKYPRIYAEVENRIETGWEETIDLLEIGIWEGKIRPIKIAILKTMLEGSLEQFFRRDILQRCRLTYQEALKEVVDILLDGITER